MDACRLRIKDIDFERKQIIIREGKGSKDRCVPHPQKIIPKLKAQIERVVKLHEQDLVSGAGWGWLPYALADKYPEAGTMLVDFLQAVTPSTLGIILLQRLHSRIASRTLESWPEQATRKETAQTHLLTIHEPLQGAD